MGYLREKIAELMHAALVAAPGAGTPPVKQIAEDLDIKYWTLMKKLEPDGNPIYIDEFVRLYRASEGALREALLFVVHECDPDLFLGDVRGRGDADGSVDDDLRRLTVTTGHMVERLERALADGRVDDDEELAVLEKINAVRDALDGIAAEIRARKSENIRRRA